MCYDIIHACLSIQQIFISLSLVASKQQAAAGLCWVHHSGHIQYPSIPKYCALLYAFVLTILCNNNTVCFRCGSGVELQTVYFLCVGACDMIAKYHKMWAYNTRQKMTHGTVLLFCFLCGCVLAADMFAILYKKIFSAVLIDGFSPVAQCIDHHCSQAVFIIYPEK